MPKLLDDKAKLLELFAGTGALGIAVENALDARTTYVAEFEEAPSKVLAHHFPDAPNLNDVTTADWGAIGPIDIISGGSPCQDISGAGRRAGMIRGNRSGLWESYREAIAVLRPRYVVWENVRGALTSKASSATDPDGKGGKLRALGRVLGDLASLGYDAEWVMVKASDIGGCHQRARIFLLAWDRYTVPALQVDVDPFAVWDEPEDQFRRPAAGLFATATETYTDKMPTAGAMRDGALHPRPDVVSAWHDVPLLRTPCAQEAGGGPLSPAQAAAQGRTLRLTGQVLDLFHPGLLDNNPKLLPTPTASDRFGPGAHGQGGPDLRTVVAQRLEAGWGEYLPAVNRWEYTFGHQAPEPTEPGARAGARVRMRAQLPEWMMGYHPGWVTSPELGISRNDQLKMIGNGVMQQQAERGINVLKARAGLAISEVSLARAA